MILAVAAYICLPKILQLLGFLVKLFLPFLLGYLFSMAVNPLADTFAETAENTARTVGGACNSTDSRNFWRCSHICNMENLLMKYECYIRSFRLFTKTFKTVQRHWAEKWSVVYMNLPSNIQQAITSAGETVSSKAAEFINMKSTPMVDYAGNFAKALPSVFIGIVVFILSS